MPLILPALEEFISRLAVRTRAEMIRELGARASSLERLKTKCRTKRERLREQEAHREIEQIGRILNFLHHDSFASAANAKDIELMKILVTGLQNTEAPSR